MRVLMFGWEFPPQITGGLGTACYGITKSLAKNNVDILFVVPKAFGNEDEGFGTLQDAGQIPAKYLGTDEGEFWKKVLYKEISSKLLPYTLPIDYATRLKDTLSISFPGGGSYGDPGFSPFSGKYGTDLWNEIERYASVTSILAQQEFF